MITLPAALLIWAAVLGFLSAGAALIEWWSAREARRDSWPDAGRRRAIRRALADWSRDVEEDGR